MTLDERQQQLCEDSPYDFSDLSALFVNCSLKPSPELSHTEGLARIAVTVMEANGVSVEMLRAVEWDLPPGVQPDMTEHGAPTDAWPALYEKVMAADILVLMTPIWLGEKSSVCTRVIERLYGELRSAQRGRPVRLLRPRRRLPGHRERGRREALRHERPVLAPAPRLSRSLPRPTPRGSARPVPGPPTSTPAPAVPRTTSPTATPPSWRGTSCTWPAFCATPAGSPPTATRGRRGTPVAGSTSPTPSTGSCARTRWSPGEVSYRPATCRAGSARWSPSPRAPGRARSTAARRPRPWWAARARSGPRSGPPRRDRPMASSTWVGSGEPDLHAEPDESETPCWSRATTSDSPRSPGSVRLSVLGRRCVRGGR